MRQYDDDLIDFPVTDRWRDHYAAQGLTYPSGRYPKRTPQRDEQNQEIRELKSIVQILRDELAEIRLTAEHPHLRETERTAPPKPHTFEE
jgi:hypothetical protein